MAIYMPGLVYFKKLQVRISAAIISNDMFWLKYFPSLNGILVTRSPTKIIMGQQINYKPHCIY